MFVGDKGNTETNGEHLIMSLWSINNDISVEIEDLVYPWSSMVAEIGGTLGLFVGFSFMMIWDGMETVWEWGRKLQNWLKK